MREISKNIKTLGESITHLHEPLDQVAESALKKRRNLSKKDTPGPESGQSFDIEALLGAGKVLKITPLRMKFLENLSKSLEDKEETSELVEEKLESIITKRWHQKLTDKQL